MLFPFKLNSHQQQASKDTSFSAFSLNDNFKIVNYTGEKKIYDAGEVLSFYSKIM